MVAPHDPGTLSGAAKRAMKRAMLRFSSVCGFALAPLVLLACGGAAGDGAPTVAPSKATAPADTSGAKKGTPEDTAASKAAAVETLTTGEAKSGACDEGHKAALEKLLGDIEAGMKTKNGEDGKPLGLQLVGKRVVALGPAAKSIEMSVTGRGTELHVLAFGVRDVSIDVLVGNAAATTLRSPFQRSATTAPLALDLPKIGVVNEVQSDSRQVAIKPGQPIVVKLSGQGCTGLVSFLRP
jgi:hypothetical protein